MVGIGLLMLAFGAASIWCWLRGRLFTCAWLHRAAVAMAPAGFVAIIAGWFTTEVGRQPYTVYGLLRTADSVSPIASPAVGASLVAFVVVYLAVFGAGTFYILRLMRRRPGIEDHELEKGPVRAVSQPGGL